MLKYEQIKDLKVGQLIYEVNSYAGVNILEIQSIERDEEQNVFVFIVKNHSRQECIECIYLDKNNVGDYSTKLGEATLLYESYKRQREAYLLEGDNLIKYLFECGKRSIPDFDMKIVKKILEKRGVEIE